jgi:hypothetical protein
MTLTTLALKSLAKVHFKEKLQVVKMNKKGPGSFGPPKFII